MKDKRAVLEALQTGELSLEHARTAMERILADERAAASTEPTAASGGRVASTERAASTQSAASPESASHAPKPRPPAPRLAPSVVTDIAIIGASGRFPGAEDVDSLWRCLAAGMTCVGRAPADRGWDVRDYFDPAPQTPGKTYVDRGAFLDDIDRFDPLFFGISPREAALMDPAARLFLQESWRAIEDAGYAPGRIDGGSWGVFAAVKGDYEMYVQREQELHLVGTEAFSAARLSYLLNLVGPAVSVDTACSSSLVAIALACDNLLLGNCDVAVAGGASVYTTPATLVSSSQSLLFSPDGHCRAFDDRANGTILGEAVAALVLKPLPEAERDRDAILGVIKGWGINQDGRTNGITAPSMRSQARLQASIYRRFGIDPERITLVEAHGTGTKLGDPIEVQALTASFREFTDRAAFCALGSIKPNIGHTFFAAGAVGVIKVLACMKHGRIPPAVHFESINEHIALAGSPFFINTELQEWTARPGELRRAAVNSFGLAGTNAHVVIEEYPRPAAVGADDETTALLVPLSARDPERLHEYAERLARFLDGEGARESLGSIAYTLQRGRLPLDERLAFVVRSRRELGEGLAAFLAGRVDNETCFRGRSRRGQADGGAGGEQSDRDRSGPAGLARAWTRGSEVDWPAVWSGERPGTAHLPTYPFARESFWLPARGFRSRRPATDGAPASAAPASPPAGERGVSSGSSAVEIRAIELASNKQWLCFVERWIAQPLGLPGGVPSKVDRPARDGAAPGGPPRPARVVVIGGSEAVHGALRRELAVAAGDAGLPAPGLERLEPAACDELEAWLATHAPPDAVFHFPPGQDVDRRLRAVLAGLRALSRRCHRRPIDVFLCLDDGGDDREAHDGALSGLLRSAMLENPDHQVRWIRHAAGDPERARDLAREWLRALELSPVPARPAVDAPGVVYRNGLRFATSQEELQAVPVTDTPRAFRPQATYLVAGGLGEVGRRLCLEIGAKFRPTLVTVARRAPDGEVEGALEQLRATGARVHSIAADITCRPAMAAAVREIKREFGRIDGVLHLARSVDDGLLVDKTPDGFLCATAAKVAGTEVLDEVTREEPLDFFLLFSSMAAFGLRGASDYAYGCAFQGEFARVRNRRRDRGERSGDTLALCWGQWEVDRHVGDARRSGLRDAGFDLIDAPSALRVIEACLNGSDGALGLVACQDKGRARAALAAARSAGVRVGPPPRATGPAAGVASPDPRLRDLRRALETLSYEQLTALHAAALAEERGGSGV